MGSFSVVCNIYSFHRHFRMFSRKSNISNLQNWKCFVSFDWRQKKVMKTNNGGADVTEKQLFHGTDSKHMHAICLNNFDWRICGTHGTAFGKGESNDKCGLFSVMTLVWRPLDGLVHKHMPFYCNKIQESKVFSKCLICQHYQILAQNL